MQIGWSKIIRRCSNESRSLHGTRRAPATPLKSWLGNSASALGGTASLLHAVMQSSRLSGRVPAMAKGGTRPVVRRERGVGQRQLCERVAIA